MPVECDYCGARENMPFSCKFCGNKFCSEHRLPENHQCEGLVRFKEERPRQLDKWIYEPFRAEKKRGRAARRLSPLDRLKGASDRRKALYLVLIGVVILTLYATLQG